ncbi:MAG: ABC transporter ATP-binding protein [Chloroflexi bacterium]|nr:ABC transporter ATP-binding protein [Chloroflexota bacterium]
MSHLEFEEEDFEAAVSGRTIRRMLGLTLPHWPWLAGFVALVALVAAQDGAFNFLKKQIIDRGITPGDTRALITVVAIYGGMAVVQAAAVLGFIYLAGILAERVQYDLRKRMFNHLQELSFSYFDRTPVGWIMSRLTSDTGHIADLITWGLLDVVWAIMSITTASAFMIYLNWKLGLMVFLIIPVLVLVAARFQTLLRHEYRAVRKINSRITGAYNETISGIRVVKALNREETNLDEFAALTGQMYHASFRAAWLSALFLPVVQFLSALALSSVAWYGGWQVSLGGMTVGDLQAFIGYIAFMLWPVQDLARVYAELQHAVASAERSFSLIDTRPEVVDRDDAHDPGTLRGDIEFDNVEFYYQSGKPVLKDFSLRVKQGETIALVGPTGGGKSTIVNLLCRFYEPKRGTIRIGGHDTTGLSLHAIQSRIGMVLQTPHLFSGTARENIRYGRLGASDSEIEEAARVAGAHDFIATLEKGYEAEVGEGGNLLSVGQKQLISLARAVLARPDIFIMDEATSSVDTLTEALIQRGMERLMKGRTSFVIAHRLSTIKRADRILVIENGGISEAGSHAELLRQRGHYYQLYTRQFRRALEREYRLGEMTGRVEVGS